MSSGASAFNDLVLSAHLNQIGVLPEDYDTCMKLEESQSIEMFERTRYHVGTCSFRLFSLSFYALLTDSLFCS